MSNCDYIPTFRIHSIFILTKFVQKKLFLLVLYTKKKKKTKIQHVYINKKTTCENYILYCTKMYTMYTQFMVDKKAL